MVWSWGEPEGKWRHCYWPPSNPLPLAPLSILPIMQIFCVPPPPLAAASSSSSSSSSSSWIYSIYEWWREASAKGTAISPSRHCGSDWMPFPQLHIFHFPPGFLLQWMRLFLIFIKEHGMENCSQSAGLTLIAIKSFNWWDFGILKKRHISVAWRHHLMSQFYSLNQVFHLFKNFLQEHDTKNSGKLAGLF